jgi:hypothetical protein
VDNKSNFKSYPFIFLAIKNVEIYLLPKKSVEISMGTFIHGHEQYADTERERDRDTNGQGEG